jgi:fructose-1,6-bisphosphatase/inositol monophosphatase family enzyme
MRQLPIDRLVIWVDPLDGTNNYVVGDVIGVTALIGIALDGKPVYGVIHHPFVPERPTYYGGPGMTLHRTVDAFSSQGGHADILPAKTPETVLSTKYHAQPFIQNFMDRLPLTAV